MTPARPELAAHARIAALRMRLVTAIEGEPLLDPASARAGPTRPPAD